MASILSVGEIQGLQENSNVVTVPSGHVIDVSSGTLKPSPGQIIKAESGVASTTLLTVNTTTNTTIHTQNFTPTVTGSVIYFSAVVPSFCNVASTGIWHGSQYLDLRIDGTIVAGYEHPGPQNNQGEAAFLHHIQYTSAAVTAGQSYQYTITHKPTNNGTRLWYYGRNTNGAQSLIRSMMMEIAQ